MAGNSSVQGLETITFTDNMSFDGTARGGAMTTNGQLWIGSTAGRHVKLGSLVSPLGTITIGYSNPNITLDINGSKIGETITGDTGGALSPTAGNWNILAKPTAGSSVSFSGSISTLSLNVTDNLLNTIVGQIAGNNSITGTENTGFGRVVLNALTSGINNSAFGHGAMALATSASNSVALGQNALDNILTGSFNIAVGLNAGQNYTSSESSNIVIGNVGTTAESNTIRIGTQGSGNANQNTCFIAGITGVTTSNSNYVTINTSTGQLGATAIPGITAWTDEAISFAAASGNGYFVTATATATLPLSPGQGAIIAFAVDGTQVLTIQANTGQFIRIGSVVSASAGTAANNARGDSVTLVFRNSDSTWIATSVIGTFTVT